MLTQVIPIYKYREFLEKIVEPGSIEPSGPTKLIFRCPICGDSKKNKRKKRGFLLTSSDGKSTVGCLNCDYRASFYYFLKENYPNHYKDWLMDVLFIDGNYVKNQEEEVVHTCYVNYDQFIPLSTKSDSEIRKTAIKLINKRRLPRHIARGWLYAEEGTYANRLIIPYYLKDGSFKYFEARDLTGKSFMKYRFPTAMAQEFYNIGFIDKTKDYFVFEGAMDSSFVRNSVATGGASKLARFFDEIDQMFHKNAIIVFDGDNDGIKKSLLMLKRGYRVFVWNSDMMRFAKGGKIDLNELVMNGFFDDVLDDEGMIPTEEIMKYVYQPSVANLLDFELYYDDQGFTLEEKKDAKFVQRVGKEETKNNRNTGKSGVRKRLHR